jgi:uncharacterized protein with PQ loop repeat
MELFGWIGSIAFSLSAAPQAWEAFKNKTCNLNPSFLALWGIGEVATLIYSIHLGATPLITNYVLNGACLAVIVRYNRK